MSPTNPLEQALSKGEFVLTAECVPPLSVDRDGLGRVEKGLPESLHAVVVSDRHHGLTGSALGCAALLTSRGKATVLPLSTRDKNRIALESEVLGAASLGIRSFLCLSGAHQTMGACRQAAGAYDIDSTQLVQALDRMVTKGETWAGKGLDPAPQLLVGAVAHPYLRPLELGILELKKKIAAGARALWTDAVFDVGAFASWMQAVRSAGLDRKAAIIASVLPLTSAAQAEEVCSRPGSGGRPGPEVRARLAAARDPAETGIALGAELATELKSIPGVRGIHVLYGGTEASASRLLAAARLA